MRWLVTCRAGVDPGHVRDGLARVGAEMAAEPLAPLSGGEVVYQATGPADLPARVVGEGLDAEVMLHPDSDLELLGGEGDPLLD